MMPRKREFAYWIIARELRDSVVLEDNPEEERSKPYVITPLGSKIRRVLIAGKVTQKNPDENMTRMTVSDSSGNFYLSAFQNDFGSEGKIMLDELEINDVVMVMGRVNSFQNEGKIYFNVNPELAVKIDDIALKYWNTRSSHVARRKIYAIKAAGRNENPSTEELVSMGYSNEEAECAIRALKNYPGYSTSEIEGIVSGGAASMQQESGSNQNKDFVLDYIRNNDEDGKGCRYEDILAAAQNANISQADVDEVLNSLGSEGDIFEVSLKRYKPI